MDSDDLRDMREAEESKMLHELGIVQRMGRHLSTPEDIRYVAASFGLTTYHYKGETWLRPAK